MKKLDSQKKLYIAIAVIVVALVLIYPYVSDIGQFVKGSSRITAAKPGPITLPVESDICTDSDYGKVYDKFGITTMNQSGTITTWTDECIADTTVNEIYCQADYGEGTWVGSVEYNCPNGCYQGHCTPPVTYGGILNMLNENCYSTPIPMSNTALVDSLDKNNDNALTGYEICQYWYDLYKTDKTCILTQGVSNDATYWEAESMHACDANYNLPGTKMVTAICCGAP